MAIDNRLLFRIKGVEVDSTWLNGYDEKQHVGENGRTPIQGKDYVLESVSQILSNFNSNNHNASGFFLEEWTDDDNFHDLPTGNTDPGLYMIWA